jgi:Fuc2NAc and GlcNAc transferase
MYDAHRSHSYQILSRKWGSHTPVTLVVAAINFFWLFPIAYMAVIQQWVYPELPVLIAYLPLIVIALKLKAGKPHA